MLTLKLPFESVVVVFPIFALEFQTSIVAPEIGFVPSVTVPVIVHKSFAFFGCILIVPVMHVHTHSEGVSEYKSRHTLHLHI